MYRRAHRRHPVNAAAMPPSIGGHEASDREPVATVTLGERFAASRAAGVNPGGV